jgi:hypothetical protein
MVLLKRCPEQVRGVKKPQPLILLKIRPFCQMIYVETGLVGTGTIA